MSVLSADTLRRVRLRAQQLIEPGPDVTSALDRIGAVQAQAMPAARLAIRVRTGDLTAADIDRAIEPRRRAVVTWAMRGTLHMLPAADVGWIVDLLGPTLIRKDERRRRQLGLDDALCARAVRALRTILAGEPLTRAGIVTRLATKKIVIDPASQAPPHLLAYAAHRGVICRAADTEDGEPTYTLIDTWLADVTPHRPADPLAELARRHLTGHAVATPADFTAWSGLSAGQGREAYALLGDELTPIGDGYALAGTDLTPPDRGPVRLLGGFDPYLLGYRSRAPILDPAYARAVQAGGMIAATVVDDGRVIGTWKIDRSRRDWAVRVAPFTRLSRAGRAALESETADVGRFIGTPLDLRVDTGD